MDYIISENTLVQIADAIRRKCVYKDVMSALVSNRDRIINIEFPDTLTFIRRYGCSNIPNLKTVTIPDSVTEIGDYAFRGCRKLESAILGSGLTKIGFGLFIECSALKDVYIHSITPPVLKNLSDFIDSTATTVIHVPVGSGDAYKSATNWSKYADIIVEDIIIE